MEKFLVRLLNHLSQMRHQAEEGSGIYRCTISFVCILFFMLLKIFQFLFIFWRELAICFLFINFFLDVPEEDSGSTGEKKIADLHFFYLDKRIGYLLLTVTFEFSSEVTRSLFWTLRRFIYQKAVQIPLEL